MVFLWRINDVFLKEHTMLKVLYITGYKNFELGIFDNKAKEVAFIKMAIENVCAILLKKG